MPKLDLALSRRHLLTRVSAAGALGDLVHHPIPLLEKSFTKLAYDTDPKRSAKSRVKC